jgi:hypothetical protein
MKEPRNVRGSFTVRDHGGTGQLGPRTESFAQTPTPRRSSAPFRYRMRFKKGGHRRETAAPNKRRQLQGVRGTGADGSTYLTFLGLLRSRLSSYLAAVDCRYPTLEQGNQFVCVVQLATARSMPSKPGNCAARATLARGRSCPQFGGVT